LYNNVEDNHGINECVSENISIYNLKYNNIYTVESGCFKPQGSIKITSSYQEIRVKRDKFYRIDIKWNLKFSTHHPVK
jgi:hypothetical protein